MNFEKLGFFLGLCAAGLSKLAARALSEQQLTDERVREVGERIGIDWNRAKFPVGQLRKGILVEYEHGSRDAQTNVTGNNLDDTARVAWAHLKEMPDYYTRLAKMEGGSY